MLCRLGLLAGWMLCHLSFYASLMMVYLLAGSVAWSCLGLVVGVPSFVVLAVLILVLGLSATCLVVRYNRLNSLCLLMFVSVVLLFF